MYILLKTMSLTESQLKVLDSIRTEQELSENSVVEGHTIAERTMFDLDMVVHLLDSLVEGGYLKSYVRQLNYRGSLESYLVELTAKGKVALKSPHEVIHSKPSITNQNFTFQGPVGVGVISGNFNTTEITQNIDQNTSAILESIKSLRRLTEEFPEDDREDANVHLSNLEEEIKLQHKRDPKKIRTYLKSLILLGTTVATLLTAGVAFTDQAMGIAQKLGYSLEINHLKPPEQLPPSP